MPKEKLQRDTGSVLWDSQRFHTYEKEVNKWIWEGVWGSWTQGICIPWIRAQRLHPDPEQLGQAQQEVTEEEEVFVHLLSPGRLFLAQGPLQQQPPPED